jgi:hypothetical protein
MMPVGVLEGLVGCSDLGLDLLPLGCQGRQLLPLLLQLATMLKLPNRLPQVVERLAGVVQDGIDVVNPMVVKGRPKKRYRTLGLSG